MPQGSILLPLLFCININDLQYCRKYASSSHFADDTCLIYASKNLKTLETNLNYDLKNLTQWLYSNRLSLNIDETKLLIFQSKYNKNNYDNIIRKVRLEHSNSVKYLGVYIDHNLSWDLQVKELSKKLRWGKWNLLEVTSLCSKNYHVISILCIFLFSFDIWKFSMVFNISEKFRYNFYSSKEKA